MKDTQIKRKRRIAAVRKKVFGTAKRPRLAVYRTNKQLYAQLINDEKGITLASSSSKNIKQSSSKANQAESVGEDLVNKAKSKGIESIVFDKRWYKYHGRVKSLADSLRKGGLTF